MMTRYFSRGGNPRPPYFYYRVRASVRNSIIHCFGSFLLLKFLLSFFSQKTEDTPATEKKAKKGKAKKGDDEEEPETTFSDYDSAGGSTEPLRKNKGKDSPAKENTTVSSKQQNAVSAALAAGVPAGQQRSVSCVADTSTQREVVVECFAPYDDHRWVNIGKERDQMAPDAVQYARALRPPYHLLSFLR